MVILYSNKERLFSSFISIVLYIYVFPNGDK